MPRFQRILLIVLDSVGIGELPDAGDFGDQGAHTLGHIADRLNGLKLPHLQKMGLGQIERIRGVSAEEGGNGGIPPTEAGYYGKMIEISSGKDTMTGHWEIMGLETKTPFKTYPEGFPPELIEDLKQKFQRGILCNQPGSGTEVIEQYGREHMETGSVIVYTSADSVLQMAAHEEIIPLDELYRLCEIAREATIRPEYLVGRVIARPFVGEPGHFTRTANRHDYAVSPPRPTVLDRLHETGVATVAVGKINDIFNGSGISQAVKTKNNMDGVDQSLRLLHEVQSGLIFTNLVDFDMLYGHRRDPEGYGQALIEFDQRLPDLLDALRQEDLLILTADHGNDPTYTGTDHTREYTPLLVYSKQMAGGGSLGIRSTFADVGATVADNFQAAAPEIGTSFLAELK